MRPLHSHSPIAWSGSVLLAGLAACSAGGSAGEPRSALSTTADGTSSSERSLERGAQVYEANCLVCHGSRGGGDGAAAPWLFPKARDFRQGRFRLVSTRNGTPTQRDLVQTLRRGMPGSAMPSWDWMSESDLRHVADYVRILATDGLARTLASEISDGDDGLALSKAYALAEERMTPGEPIPRLPDIEVDAEHLRLGRSLFLESCARCHGDDGRGHPEPRYDESGRPNWARDLQAGFLKGGATVEDLDHRIQSGMPGSAMPQTTFEDDTRSAALAAFVRSLIPLGTEARLVHRRERIQAYRAPTVPERPADPVWDTQEETMVVLAPLWWKEGSVLQAFVSAYHDGSRLALRIRWADDSPEKNIFSDVMTPDGVALQFSLDSEPPLFAMGSRDHPTSIWHWKSLRLSEVAGGLDLLDTVPHQIGRTFSGEVRLDVPVYSLEEGTPSPSTTVKELEARGAGETQPAAETEGGFQARPIWKDGSWRVVLTRSMTETKEGEVPLEAGTSLHLALAIWNGSAGDHNGQKSISIWQELALDP